jgi:hypothetical protein
MMRMWTVLPAALAVLAAESREAAGQERFAVKLAPTVGWYAPTQNLRRVPEEGSSDWTRIAAGPMAGLTAELGLPVRAVSVRGGLMYVRSGLDARRFAGFESCGSDCDEAVYRSEPIAGARVFIAVADVVLRTPRIGPVQPYVLGGAGIKRYDFAQRELSGGYAAEYARDVTQGTRHVGLGTDLRVGNHLLVLEVSDYVGGFRSAADPAQSGTTAPGGRRQHDISFTAGFKFGIGGSR